MSFRIFQPLLAGARLSERVIGCVGAAICLSLTMWLCGQLPLDMADLPVIVAPLGASAVLVFAVPSSPLAQPWSVVGGNTLSAMVGVAVFQAVPNLAVASGLAVALAILVMSLLRCLHPPGGAAALTAVIGSQGIHDAGFAFALAPVGLNSIALVSLAMFYHRATARSYPHHPPVTPEKIREVQAEAGFEDSDIDAALEDMHESFDIAREDLDLLLSRARLHARARRGILP